LGFKTISSLRCSIFFSIALHFFLAIVFFKDFAYQSQQPSSVNQRLAVTIVSAESVNSAKNEAIRVSASDAASPITTRSDASASNVKKREIPRTPTNQNSESTPDTQSKSSSAPALLDKGDAHDSKTPHILTPPLSLVLIWPKNLANEVTVVVVITPNDKTIEFAVKSSSGAAIIDAYVVNYIRELVTYENINSLPQELSVVISK
jgi:hypothetical protein